MVASVLDLRRKMREIVYALEHNEKVTLTRRGKKLAVIVPYELTLPAPPIKPEDIPGFGMWADREDMADPVEYVEKMRKGRFEDAF